MSSRSYKLVLVPWIILCAIILIWGNSKTTPKHSLLDALANGDITGVESLLNNGASANTFDKQGRPIIENADTVEMFELLLKHGAKLQGTPKGHPAFSVLWPAVSDGDLNRVKYLISKGADPSFHGPQPNQPSAFVEALLSGHYEIASYILALKPPVVKPKEILEGLGNCVLEDDVRTIRRFINEGKETLGEFSWKNELLFQAAEDASPRVTAFCLDQGADIDDTLSNGYTPLMEASAEYMPEDEKEGIVHLLLSRGASPNAVSSSDHETVLYHAIQGSAKFSLIKMLLGHGADPNIQNRIGFSALHLAVSLKNKELVELLLDSGANPLLVDKSGQTPFQMAKKSGNMELLEVFVTRGVHEQ
jgi:ankyrin repeat protein